MTIYKKKVKRHEEVWGRFNGEDYEDFDSRVRVCIGNSNYGRLYVVTNEEFGGYFLSDEETQAAFLLFKEIWADNADNNPFGE